MNYEIGDKERNIELLHLISPILYLFSLVLPHQHLIRSRRKKVRHLAISFARKASVGVADQLAVAVVQVAEKITTDGRYIIHGFALVSVAVNFPWRILHFLLFELCDKIIYTNG